jgi:hypothetical protein
MQQTRELPESGKEPRHILELAMGLTLIVEKGLHLLVGQTAV